jgi:hypothetical protein
MEICPKRISGGIEYTQLKQGFAVREIERGFSD